MIAYNNVKLYIWAPLEVGGPRAYTSLIYKYNILSYVY